MKQWQANYGAVLCVPCCAAILAFAPLIALAQQTPQSRTVTTAKQKAAPTPPQKAAVPQKVVRRPPRGPIEKFDCKIGSEDNHSRIALLAQGGEVQSVAYYSKWKPRTCSVHLQRGDAYSRWKDTGDATTISTEFGDFLIQASRAEYQLFFREVDRMHYCGMMGKLNGSITVTRGARRQCSVEGIMDRDDETEGSQQTEARPAAPEAQSAAGSDG